jgi:outer membrane protein assembly factor BamB
MKTSKRLSPWSSLFVLTLVAASPSIDEDANADWPQWRGPDRDGVSGETELLTSWPDSGPEVLWRVPLGEGYSSVSVAQGRVYTMSGEGPDEFVLCLDASSGAEIWRFRSDSKFSEAHGNGPRSTPTVDGDRVFVLSTKGKLYALGAKNGEKLWQHDFRKQFGSSIPIWGFATSPLVENDLLVVEVGGEPGKSIVAFDKTSGAVVWTSHSDKPAYSSPIAVTLNGIRQIVFLTSKTLLSVAPADGQIYWQYDWPVHGGITVATPILIPTDKLFISSGYDTGAALVQVKESHGKFAVEEVWKSRVMKNHFNSSVRHENYLYGFDNFILKCIEASSGKEQWAKRGFEKGSLILADGHLIVLSEEGKLAVVEAVPAEYREKATFQVLEGTCWTPPTLDDGKLYVRSEKELACLDMTGPSI